MLRILLLVIIGAFLAMMALRAVAALIALPIDLIKGATYTPLLLIELAISTAHTFVFGWSWKRIYLRKKLFSEETNDT